MHTKFYLENLKESTHWHRWEGTVEGGYKEICCENVNFFSLALDKDQCWAVVNVFHKVLGNVFTIYLPAAISKKNSLPHGVSDYERACEKQVTVACISVSFCS